ncbi:MAG: flavodoxin-dependent (E)-4-hydroxy-3-methylbut-2-enyl-diphosphate synthase [Eubacterium sp.]|nr:flavodoxin-dependent (E)-4-hydroxy-3-methylbut-2-enyl-diphosphate synthase [Eubacterium sp.]
MEINRKKTRVVTIGDRRIGGGNPVLIQSMTNTDTRDAQATVAQIKRLELAGCDIVRVAVPDMAAAKAIGEIKRGISIPLVADIHFNHTLALEAIRGGVDKLRINPGNIGDKNKVREVVAAAKDAGIPIRIGVNAGSLEKELLLKYGRPTPAAMVESAEKHIAYLEEFNFEDIVVSMKASDVRFTIDAYSLFSKKHDYPLHLGITEAGVLRTSSVKSGIGIGYMLLSGIGDTIRVSITGDPVDEVYVAKDILKSIDMYAGDEGMVEVVSCPTCGRTEIDLIGIAEEMNARLRDVKKNIKVAVMGCVVNGPGEGREADIGVAGGKGKGVLFKKGEVFKTVSEDEIIDALMAEIEEM